MFWDYLCNHVHWFMLFKWTKCREKYGSNKLIKSSRGFESLLAHNKILKIMVAVIFVVILGIINIILNVKCYTLEQDLKFYKTQYNQIRKEYSQLRRQQVVKQHVEDLKKQRKIINKHNGDLK